MFRRLCYWTTQQRQRPRRPVLLPDVPPWRSDVVGRSNSVVDVSAFPSTSPAAAAAVGDGVCCRWWSTTPRSSPSPRPVVGHVESLPGGTVSCSVTASAVSSTELSGAGWLMEDDPASRWESSCGGGVQSGSAMRMRRREMVEYCMM